MSLEIEKLRLSERYERQNYFLERQRYLLSALEVVIKLFIPLTILMIGLFILPSLRDLTSAYVRNLELSNTTLSTLPDLEERIDSLSQVIARSSSSELGERVSAIETLINAAKLDKAEISTFGEIQKQVSKLSEYISENPDQIIELRALISDIAKIKPLADQAVSREDLKQELDSLRFVINMIATVGGLLVTLLFGFIVVPPTLRAIGSKSKENTSS